jgi:hypothetical protein
MDRERARLWRRCSCSCFLLPPRRRKSPNWYRSIPSSRRTRVGSTPSGQPLSKDDVAKATYAISIERAALVELLKVEAEGPVEFRLALRKTYDAGLITTLSGSIQDFEKAFFDWFDPKPVDRPTLVIGLPTPDFAKR